MKSGTWTNRDCGSAAVLLEANPSIGLFWAIVMVLAINKHLSHVYRCTDVSVISILKQAGFVIVKLGSWCPITS